MEVASFEFTSVDVAFVGLAAASIATGYRVFRTDSMIRATFLLLASFLNVGAMMLLLAAPYMGVALMFMMTVEMVVMALFMLMFMMNPAGLNPMNMVHQPRMAAFGGVVGFAALAAVAVLGDYPDRPVDQAEDSIAALGEELLGDSMVIFETAGVTLLAAMVGAVALTSSQGRFGDGLEGSLPPTLRPGSENRPEDDLYDPNEGGMDHGAMDHGAMDHGAMDHGAMDHGAMSEGEMDHGAMDHGASADHDAGEHR